MDEDIEVNNSIDEVVAYAELSFKVSVECHLCGAEIEGEDDTAEGATDFFKQAAAGWVVGYNPHIMDGSGAVCPACIPVLKGEKDPE